MTVRRVVALMIFEHGMCPNVVEAMRIGRLFTYLSLALDLAKERRRQAGN